MKTNNLTVNKIASMIAKREGKKSQVAIGDIREILKILCTIEAEDIIADPNGDSIFGVLTNYSESIAEKLRKKKKK